MESINSIWLVGIAAFVGGGVIGAILYRLITPTAKNAVKLTAQLEESKQALEEYKAKVTGHFDKTSDLVNELTQDYVKVYKHLADGAQMLGDPEKAANMLGQQSSEALISFSAAADQEAIDESSQEIIAEAVKEAAEAIRETSGDTGNAEAAGEVSDTIAPDAKMEFLAGAESDNAVDATPTADNAEKVEDADEAKRQPPKTKRESG